MSEGRRERSGRGKEAGECAKYNGSMHSAKAFARSMKIMRLGP